MNIALDIITIMVIMGCIYGGFKTGFINSLFGFLSSIIAVIAAFFASAPLGNFICGKWIGPFAESQTASAVAKLTGGAGTAGQLPIEQLLSGPESVINSLISGAGTTIEQVKNAFSKGIDLVGARENAVRAISQPMAETVSRIIAFIVIFIAALIIMKIVAKLLSGVFSLPGLNALNKLAGLVFGAAKGLLFMLVICSLISFAKPLSEKFDKFAITDSTIENTLAFKAIYNVNPLPHAGPMVQN